MTDRFHNMVRCLLHERAPPEGAAALLLRRERGQRSVFFPIDVVAGTSFGRPPQLLRNYFLYSMHWDAIEDDAELTLDDQSGMESLILRGKLALALFTAGPVAIRVHVCDTHAAPADRDLLLCTFRRPSADAPPAPSLYIRSVFSELVAAWREASASNLKLVEGDHHVVAHDLATMLSDEFAEPPYFPTLHVKLDSRPGVKGNLTPGQWKTNSLSYNCFLMNNRTMLEPYIEKMFLAQKIADVDTAVQSQDPLVRAIVSVCDDFVQQVGVHPPTGTLVYARRNIRKSSYRGDPAKDPAVAQKRISSMSLWTVLRTALEFMCEEHKDSALVTLWAGQVDGDVSVRALPMGFVPGAQSDLLARVAEHSGLQGSDRIFKKPSKNHRLELTAILLDAGDSGTEHHARAHSLITPVLDSAARVVRGATEDIRYPGPYTIDFQNDVTKACLICDSDDVTVAQLRCVSGASATEILTYLLLMELARAEHHFLNHNQLDAWSPGRGKKSAKIAEAARTFLAKLEVDPEGLVKNRYSEGWELPLGTQDVKRIPKKDNNQGTARKQVAPETKGVDDADPASLSDTHSVFDRKDELMASEAWSRLTNTERDVIMFTLAPTDDSIQAFLKRTNLDRTAFEEIQEKATIKLRQGLESDQGRSRMPRSGE